MGSSQPRDWAQVSCIAGRFFYQLSHKGSPNIGVHISFSVLVSSRYMPNSEIAGSYGSFIPGETCTFKMFGITPEVSFLKKLN